MTIGFIVYFFFPIKNAGRRKQEEDAEKAMEKEG